MLEQSGPTGGSSYEGPQSPTAHDAAVSDHPDSLFSEQQRQDAEASVPWWRRIDFLSKNRQHLFGTWDGVFTTVMVNIFGTIAFLRMGWIVVSGEMSSRHTPIVFDCRARLALVMRCCY
jgi:hypothetical protein